MVFVRFTIKVAFFVACMMLFSCSKVTQENFEKIQTHMTIDQVISVLGKPTNSEKINLGGISGISAIWRDANGEIDIQFLNDKVIVKSFSKAGEDKPQTNV